MMPVFQRLVRFIASDGQIYYGETGDDWQSELVGRTVKVFTGLDPWAPDFELSNQFATIQQVICPLDKVPNVLGIGLNYRLHVKEAGFPMPSEPVLFSKAADSLAGPYEDVPCHPVAKEVDWEGELCLVMGRDAKNIPEDQDPLSYVLGYTVGNDVSSRYWQRPERCGGHFNYAKSFDKFSPVGPVIASLQAVGNPEDLRLRTWVGNELMQDGKTNDLIFDLRRIVRHCSNGTTLRRGTIIMTGTPSGIGATMTPSRFLKDQDVVKIEVERIGTIRNKMVFQ
ncbi:Fumarylacetoacetate hydrolase domain-containing protein 2A [Metarhizium brunneum]|uniref:Fumarylacetoacetate hydrolase domain-containing protein 2A n=1 Tax=Metarhizium brunneum TaxID=500148 RepID=A0A7D5UY60_9HYPO